MLIKNTAYNTIEAVVNSKKITIKQGEVKDIPKNVVDVILGSHRGKDIEIVSTSVDLNDYLVMEEV